MVVLPSLSSLCERHHIPDRSKAPNTAITTKRLYSDELALQAVNPGTDLGQGIQGLMSFFFVAAQYCARMRAYLCGAGQGRPCDAATAWG